MATRDQHRERAEHNEYLVTTLNNPFWDWGVVVTFYAALHYVESYFAAKNIKHPVARPNQKPSHSSRLPLVANHLRGIYKDYGNLYNDSRDARYEADLVITQKDAQQSQKQLESIKAVVMRCIQANLVFLKCFQKVADVFFVLAFFRRHLQKDGRVEIRGTRHDSPSNVVNYFLCVAVSQDILVTAAELVESLQVVGRSVKANGFDCLLHRCS